MLKVQSTVYPPSRNGGANPNANVVREGGLYYKDGQDELVREAQNILNANPINRKDQIKEFAKIFWIVAGVISAGVVIGAVLFS